MHNPFLFDTDSIQWMQFQHQIVRELAFCIASPPLLQTWPNQQQLNKIRKDIELPATQFWQTQFKHYLPRLKQLDQNPFELQQHLLTARSSRLGIRFEHLLTFWLLDDHYHPFKLIGQSIKRMDGTRTVGELDFLISNQLTGQIEHWEVAIKFYLGEADFFAEQWLGLNRRDSLGRKINHLQQHQFDVSEINEHVIQKRRAIIKGRLFYPLDVFDSLNGSLKALQPSPWVNEAHLTGTWGNIIPSTPPKHQWRRAARPEWIVAQDNVQPLSTTAYWNNGLYFLINSLNQVISHYVLRIADKRCSPLKSDNILKLNTHAADIFKQISMR